MNEKNNLIEDKSIDEDAELIALEALLSAPDDEQNKPKNQQPRIVEDDFLAEEFAYEIDLPKKNVPSSAKIVKTNVEEPDSSDDEEVKNFLERKYNEYGSDINKRLKQQRQEKHEAKVARDVQKNLNESKETNVNDGNVGNCIKNPHQPKVRQSLLSTSFQKVAYPQLQNSVASNNPKPAPKPITAAPVVPTFTDPVFGLRIINPMISSTLLVERMAGRKAVPVSQIPFHIERGDLSKDWVFAGVVVNKSPIQTTKKGAAYSIWRLSDLRGEMKLIALFLFSGAHKELWKTAQGMCIAVLNPTIFEKRAKSDEVACLSIDTAQKVMVLGQSKDMGTCKARKRDGEPCTSIVNLGECDYCIYHMKQEYGKMSKRSELQSTSGGVNQLRNKVLGKSEVFYGGQSYTAIPAKKSAKLILKDTQRMSALSEYAVSPFAASVDHASKPRNLFNKPVPYAAREGPVSRLAANVECNMKQRQKDLERLRILQADAATTQQQTNENVDQLPSTSSPKTSSPAITTTSNNVPDKFKNREFSFLARTPSLSSENFSIEVNVGEKRAQFAKHKAAQILKQRPLEKINPNSTRGTNAGKRRAIDELNEKFTSQEFKRQKLEEAQREQERKSRVQRIIDATTSHSNLVDLREQEEQDKYFSKQEKKEALEEKMLNTYKVPCKAVICQLCKYTAFSAAERCKEEKHPLKVIDAEKRFFQCKDCGNRTCTVFKLPKTSCKNCQSSRWVRAAMIRERKLCSTGDGLSVRGDEETFIGSLAGSANLNLLVPEN